MHGGAVTILIIDECGHARYFLSSHSTFRCSYMKITSFLRILIGWISYGNGPESGMRCQVMSNAFSKRNYLRKNENTRENVN